MLFALNGLYWFHKKLTIISSIDVKRLLRTWTPVFLFFSCKKKGLLCVTENFSASILTEELISASGNNLLNYTVALGNVLVHRGLSVLIS